MTEHSGDMVARILQCRATARALADEGYLDLSADLEQEADELTKKLQELRRRQRDESGYDRIQANRS